MIYSDPLMEKPKPKRPKTLTLCQKRLKKKINIGLLNWRMERAWERAFRNESTKLKFNQTSKENIMNFEVIDVNSFNKQHESHGMGTHLGGEMSIKEELQEDVEFEEVNTEDRAPAIAADPLWLGESSSFQAQEDERVGLDGNRSWQVNADLQMPDGNTVMIKLEDETHSIDDIVVEPDECSWIKKEYAESDETWDDITNKTAENIKSEAGDITNKTAEHIKSEAGVVPGPCGSAPFKIKLEEDTLTPPAPEETFDSLNTKEGCAGTDISGLIGESLLMQVAQEQEQEAEFPHCLQDGVSPHEKKARHAERQRQYRLRCKMQKQEESQYAYSPPKASPPKMQKVFVSPHEKKARHAERQRQYRLRCKIREQKESQCPDFEASPSKMQEVFVRSHEKKARHAERQRQYRLRCKLRKQEKHQCPNFEASSPKMQEVCIC